MDLITQAIELLKAGEDVKAAQQLSVLEQTVGPNADILHAKAILAQRAGKPAEAVRLFEAALALAPGDASITYDLAYLFAIRRQTGNAMAMLERTVRLDPRHFPAWLLLGKLYAQERDYSKAEEALLNCVELAPGESTALMPLFKIYRDSNRHDKGSALWQRAKTVGRLNPASYLSYGGFLIETGQADEARKCFEEGIVHFPLALDLYTGLGQVCEDAGDRPAAISAYRSALKLQGNSEFALAGLLQLTRDEPDDALVERGGIALQARGTHPKAKAVIGYALGKVFQGRKQYAESMNALRLGNEARRQDSGAQDRVGLNKQIEQTISIFTREFLEERRHWGNSDERPVFIVGMPRSGTTLLEQVLASHPQVEGLGELPELPALLTMLTTRLKTVLPWPLSAPFLSADDAKAAAAEYLAGLDRRVSENYLRLVDKAPLNFFHVGLIKLLLPNARIIWCRRNPIDVCFSIYSENFAVSQHYASDLGDIAYLYKLQDRLMDHWRNAAGIEVLEVQYEQVVADFEPQIRRALSFLGLEWDDRCLRYSESDRTVQTPSRWQVRKPIYGSSVGKWAHYRPWIGELTQAFPEYAAPRDPEDLP